MKSIRNVLIILFSILSFVANSKNYFVSNKGNDKNDGRFINSSFQTIDAINKLSLKPGDTIFLERGSIFIGPIIISNSGTELKPIIVTSYGKGNKPVITGAIRPREWKKIDSNVFETTIKNEVFDVYVNEDYYTQARFPNNSYLTIEQGFGKDSILNSTLNQHEGYWDNAYLRIRTIDWAYETRKIKHSKPGILIQGEQNRYYLDKGFLPRMKNGIVPLYEFKKGYGFYLEGLMSMIDSAREWSWNNSILRIQFPVGLNPDSQNIQVVTKDCGVILKSGTRNISIIGIEFKHFEKSGITGGVGIKNVSILSNSFKSIHGVGICIDSISSNVLIQKNNFQNILGRGISVIEPEYSVIENNILKCIGLIRGKGWTGVNGATGIVIYNNERKKSKDSTYSHHNIIKNNRLDSCGYIGIRVDGNHNLIENNLVENCSLTLNDGANIYSFATEPNITHHTIIRGNIVRNSVGDSYMTPDNPNLAFGIYLDNNSHDMLVEGNTVISTNASGITNNDASFRNIYRNNITYDCKEGIGFSEWANHGRVFDCVVEGNIFIAAKPAQKGPNLTNFIGPVFNVGVFSNNTYVNIGATNYFYFQTKQLPQPSKLDLTFDQWKQIIQSDSDSRAITAETKWCQGFQPVIFVNDKATIEHIELDSSEFLDLQGNPVSQTPRLAPFYSLILLKKNKQ